jgi:type III secretory pathway lipoprotein EscJ
MIHGPLDDATIFANKIRLFVLNSYPDVIMANITVVLFAKHESFALPYLSLAKCQHS